MAEKIIGSLIYGDHKLPTKYRPWKERLKVPVAIGTVLLVIGGIAYTFANYREERRVAAFIENVRNGRFDAAYALWDVTDGDYSMDEFLNDWGETGYYTEGAGVIEVADSNSSGVGVIVYVAIDTFNEPVALMVNKETLKVSYSPISKYDP
jgi:hypothetical protein